MRIPRRRRFRRLRTGGRCWGGSACGHAPPATRGRAAYSTGRFWCGSFLDQRRRRCHRRRGKGPRISLLGVAMYTLRCTARLIARLPLDEPDYATRAGATTTRLGDWYATVHTQHRRAWVLAVSERSLLPVLIPLAPAYNLPLRLMLAVSDWMRALGVSSADALRETDGMSDGFQFGPT